MRRGSETSGGDRLPARIEPMLAVTAAAPADGKGWAFEVKWDGIRALARCGPAGLVIENRRGVDITARYPELANLPPALRGRRAVLDGEIVVLDGAGRADFQALQARIHVTDPSRVARLAHEHPAVYVVFDLLHLDGRDLTGLPYDRRREALAQLAPNAPGWRAPDALFGDPQVLVEVSREHGLEGLIAKRRDAAYLPGRRSSVWRKLKNVHRQEFVIGGYTAGAGRRAGTVGSLLVGVYRDGELRYAGRVGSGLGDAELDRLSRLLAARAADRSPFVGRPPAGSRFVRPELVCECEFSGWTAAALLRQPSYRGLRDDVGPGPVVREPDPRPAAGEGPLAALLRTATTAPRGGVEVTVDRRRLRLTNLDKVLYPAAGTTKADVLDYHLRIAPAMLPHLRDRAVTLIRFPDGVERQPFFEKRCLPHRPAWVRVRAMPSERSGTIDQCLANDRPTLLWLANLAALELHVPTARVTAPERPTAVVFDLDPGAGASVVECAEVALLLRGTFRRLGLESVVKTSGSKGLHVLLPLNHRAAGHAAAKAFARSLAELWEHERPELVVSRQTRRLRAGRVLVDWSQNDRSKTTVCAYSLRGQPRPTASAPVDWSEVEECAHLGDPDRLRFTALQ
ncbi:MAG TPA: DNA ligase D, partial [Gaiellales bacterium]|nr:DNA ligase D [Gaiellales bacterium]